MGAYTSTSVTFLPYNTVAVTPLDRLVSESERKFTQNIPHLDVELEMPVDIEVDGQNRVYVANRDSGTISVIDGETLKLVKDVDVG